MGADIVWLDLSFTPVGLYLCHVVGVATRTRC